MKSIVFVVTAALSASLLVAQTDPSEAPKTPPKQADKSAEPATALEAFAKYQPVTGVAKVGSVATVKLAEGWLWLDGARGRKFLTDIGNRPGPETLGVAVPADFLTSNVFAVYSYADEGHVADDETPDYDDLLVQMKDAAVEDNEARKAAGLQGVTMVGWAEPPHYDKDQHKMFWAERLHFDGEQGDTLNYNVRVLGRTGHLVVNGVGDIEQLPVVAAHSKALLTATEFVDGQRYTDFKPEYDKIAAYGIGGLVAGKLALKVGLFAKLGILFVKFLKPILVGFAIVGGLLWKLIGGGKKDEDMPRQRPTAAS
ncbi:MAG: DUF2167 domain-containing protein [Planctomycetes bacterium]|nr:DUF2167 domain-containing protein [Planctomycetota bacterium]